MAVLGSTSLTGCNSIPDFIAAGSLMLFQQTSAPTSWTKDTTSHNNKALRVVTGTASSGGSAAFTTAFASRTPTGTISASSGQIAADGTVNNHTLTTPEIPSHLHPINVVTGTNPNAASSTRFNTTTAVFQPAAAAVNSNATGGGDAHSHPFSGSQHNHPISATFSGSAQDFAVQYVDIIIASKN
jgi:microcystin-dependent protein